LYAVAGSKANTYDPIVLTLSVETKNGTTSCKVTVYPAFTRKKIAAIGSSNVANGYMAQRGASQKFLTADANFGNSPTSTVQMVATSGAPFSGNTGEGTTRDYHAFEYTYYGSLTTANLKSATDAKPDIIILGYNHVWDAAFAKTALAYLNKGGIILDFSGENASSNYILNAIFGTSNITSSTATPRTATLANMSDDPIINGPFKTIDGNHIGGLPVAGDVENSLRGYTNIPSGGLIVYAYSGTNPTCFRTTGQRYFIFGDGGFLSGSGSDYPGTSEPFAINTSNGTPVFRPISSGYSSGAYNSYLFGNVMAWAIKEAQFNGINSKP
jgi:hypothetical protein